MNYFFSFCSILIYNLNYFPKFIFGDWGLGIGDWAQSPIPHPQFPIPQPPSLYLIIIIIINIIHNSYNLLIF